MHKSLRAKVKLSHPVHFLGFGFGAGLTPFMPGTMGSLAAVPIIFAMSYLPLWGFVAITLLSVLVGIPICQKVSDDLAVHDHGAIVWDEIAGMMIVFIAIPMSWHALLLGFVLFRIFDIWKPWPISYFDKNVHGGWGIMVDDIIAGTFALFMLHGIYYFLDPLLSL